MIAQKIAHAASIAGTHVLFITAAQLLPGVHPLSRAPPQPLRDARPALH
jgi:hypothetical protein